MYSLYQVCAPGNWPRAGAAEVVDIDVAGRGDAVERPRLAPVVRNVEPVVVQVGGQRAAAPAEGCEDDASAGARLERHVGDERRAVGRVLRVRVRLQHDVPRAAGRRAMAQEPGARGGV